jgi:aminopeptidase YwaD
MFQQFRGRNRARAAAPTAVLFTLSFLPLAAHAQKAADFRPDTLQSHIAYLASEKLRGRGSGDRGNEMAAAYIAEAFKKAGLKPVGTGKANDAAARMDGSGYYQPFRFPAGVAKGRDNRLQATWPSGERPVTATGTPGGGALAIKGSLRLVWQAGTKRYSNGSEFEVHPLSGKGSASGEVVFLGYGRAEDYTGIDAKGKIVLVLAGSPTGASGPANITISGKAALARDKGAAAVLVVPATDDALRFDGTGTSADVGLPLLLLRRSIAELWVRAAEKGLDAAPFATGVRVTLTTDVERITKVTANVLGLLEGSDPTLKNEIIVVGAHMDHLGMGGVHSLDASGKPAIHHGADDNASGTAGVLALAEYFARRTPRPKRSILFMAFSGEELGLLGSMHYVKNPALPLDKTVAMVNMDMIGRMQNNRLTVIGTGTSPTWNGLIDELNGAAKFDLGRNEGGFGGSDHQSFYNAKIPVLFFFTGLHADYHRPSDTAEKINTTDTARVVSFVAQATERIAGLPERPAYQQTATAAAASPQRSVGRASLGTIPEYGGNVVGVLLGGVREGSPAEKAGLKAGDIIIQFGDRTIRNIEEYTAALGDAKPGDVVKIVVKRGNETVTVTATLGESRRPGP